MPNEFEDLQDLEEEDLQDLEEEDLQDLEERAEEWLEILADRGVITPLTPHLKRLLLDGGKSIKECLL